MVKVLFRLCFAAAVCGAATASDLGEDALRAGDTRSAARFYRTECSRQDPGSESWRHGAAQLVRIAVMDGDLKSARAWYGHLSSYEKPETSRMRELQTSLLFAEGAYAKAAETAALPVSPAPTPQDALRLFSLRHRALLALQQYEAAEKAAAEFCSANPQSGTTGKMLYLYSAILAGDTAVAQRLFSELEKSPDSDPDALKKLRFTEQIRAQKEPLLPGADSPRPSGPDELLFTAYSLLADRAESAAKPEIAIAALKLAAEAAPDRNVRRNVQSRLLNAYLAAGRKKEAADCSELLLQDLQSDPAVFGTVLLRTARLHAESGQTEQAMHFYRRAIDDKTLPVSCRLAAARECAALHSRAKEFDKAHALYLFILENGTCEAEKQEGNFLLGEAAYSSGDYRSAVQFFGKSERCPEWRDRSLFWLIQSRMQLNELNPALDAAETLAAAKDPDFAASGAFYRAVLLEKLGRRKDAAEAYTRFCRTCPKSVYVRDALLHTAAVQKELKNYAAALRADLEFAGRFSGDDEAPAALCRAFESAFLAGDRNSMQEILKLLIRRYPNSPCTSAVLFGEIDVLHAEHRDSEALALLEQLSRIQPSPKAEQAAQIRYERARLLDALGRQSQAIQELQLLLTECPNSLRGADALLLSGSIRSDLGEYEQAAEDYRRAAALRPGGDFAALCQGRVADCLYSRAALKYDEKLLSEALEIYRNLSHSPDFRVAAQSLYKCGRCLELAGKDEDALAVYNDMLYAAVNARKKSLPWSPEWVSRAVYAGCMIYLDDGSVSSAREAVRMLRLFRSLGVETGENFDAMEKKIREKHRL